MSFSQRSVSQSLPAKEPFSALLDQLLTLPANHSRNSDISGYTVWVVIKARVETLIRQSRLLFYKAVEQWSALLRCRGRFRHSRTLFSRWTWAKLSRFHFLVDYTIAADEQRRNHFRSRIAKDRTRLNLEDGKLETID